MRLPSKNEKLNGSTFNAPRTEIVRERGQKGLKLEKVKNPELGFRGKELEMIAAGVEGGGGISGEGEK